MTAYKASKRVGLVIATVSALTIAAAGAASAQNVHLKPPKSTPLFNDQGLTLQAAGALAGLSGADILVGLSARANATAVCTNPSGQNQPAGQNPAPVTVSGSEAIPSTLQKNGNVSFNVTTNPPVTPIAGAPGCPNSNWTESISDLSFTQATLTVTQPAVGGSVVFTLVCTFAPATSNGVVPDQDVSCMSPPS
jgi:hypothetical protein